jgi:hypothetical protein
MNQKTKLLVKFLITFLLLVTTFSSKANHIIGSEITYQCTETPGIYKVNVKIYRDCQGVQLCGGCPVSLNPACSIQVKVQGVSSPVGSNVPASPCSGYLFGNYSLPLLSGVNVFDALQLCDMVQSICTNCGTRNAGMFSPGVEVYVFSGNINLSSIPSSCCLVSIGYGTCCRNNSTISLSNPGSLDFFTEAIINRCASPCNSSPIFNDELNFVLASGRDCILNYGAIDPDGDSLTYYQGPALIRSQQSAPYQSPYSNTTPFPYLGAPLTHPNLIYPAGIWFNMNTGTYAFRPIGNFISYIVVEVNQWKKINGVPTLMGITRKEHQIYSLTTNQDSIPIMKVYNNGQLVSNYYYGLFTTMDTVCAGTTFCRQLVALDPNVVDTTDISVNMPANIQNSGGIVSRFYNPSTRALNGPRFDSVQFCWTPPNNMASTSPYYINFNGKDMSCPIRGKTIHNLGIIVRPSPEVTLKKVLTINDSTFKFSYLASGAQRNPALTKWKFETSPNSNTYNTIIADSVNSYTFSNLGWHNYTLQLFGNCPSKEILDSILITNLKLTVNAKNLICKNDSSGKIILKAIGGIPPYKYAVKAGINHSVVNDSDYSIKDTFDRLAANTYTIYVKDSATYWATGLYTIKSTVTLTQPANTITLKVLNKKRPTCNGDSNGVITIGAINPSGPFQIKLDSGGYQTNPIFSSLNSGTHLFTIKDSIGCLVSQGVSLENPPILNAGITSQLNIKCKGDSNASILLSVSGGIAPYKMRINGSTYQTSPNFTNLKAGQKLIEIEDSNNCFKTISSTVTEPNNKITVSVLSKSLISCSNPIGWAVLTATDGTPPYKYGRVGGPAPSASPILQNLPSGKITFLATDSNLCRATIIDTIKTINPLYLLLTKNDIACNGANNGTITCSAYGGLGSYQYKLDAGTFQNNNVFYNVSAGNHTITVKDSTQKDTASCYATNSITINEPTKINATILATPTACAGLSTGTASVTAIGGKMPYSYSWNSVPTQSGIKAINLPAGKVVLTIVDSNACVHKDSVVIEAKPVFNEENICAVSADSTTNRYKIVWNKTPNKGVAAYQIWIAPNSTATPTLLTTIPYLAPSEFVDNISAPLPPLQAYYYSLKSVDSCATISTASFTHKPLSLNAIPNGNKVNLSWVPYSGGVNINQYKVHRAINNGSYSMIATVPYGTQVFIDSLAGAGTKHYKIEGEYAPLCNSNLQVFSNGVTVFPTGVKEASLNLNNYLIYPNPASGIVFLKKTGPGKERFVHVEVRSLTGAILFTKQFDTPQTETSIDIKELAAGNYYVILKFENNLQQVISLIVK